MKKTTLFCAAILVCLTVASMGPLAADSIGLAEGNDGAPLAAGDIVTFGRYQQTESVTDRTPIEWLVLERDDEKVLLVSRYLLEDLQFNQERTGAAWDDSTLRIWLNVVFLNMAFTEDERAAILLTDLDNSWKEGHGRDCVDGGADTQDMVFLLSYKQAMRYFRGKKDRVCAHTDYLVAKFTEKYGVKRQEINENGYWWLRSPGQAVNCVIFIQDDGSIAYGYVTNEDICVRPALWVDLASIASHDAE